MQSYGSVNNNVAPAENTEDVVSTAAARQLGEVGRDEEQQALIDDSSSTRTRRPSLLRAASIVSPDPGKYALRPEDVGIHESKVEARMRFSVFSLANTVIGGGILSLPLAFALSGALLGGLGLLAVFAFSLYSLHVLTRCAELTGLESKATYREVAQIAFGRWGVLLTDVCMIVSCFGVMCSYVIIINDTLSPLILEVTTIDPKQLRIIILCCATGVLLPLSTVRYLNALRYTSILAIVAVLYVVVAIIIRSSEALANGALVGCEETAAGCVVVANFSSELFTAIPIIGFAFTCQMNYYGTYSELASPSPRRMGKVSFRALSICLFIYVMAGLFGYLQFRGVTPGNILNAYGSTDPLFVIARIAIATEIVCGYPLTAHPCIATVDGLFFGVRPFSWLRKVVETTCLCGLGLLIAVFVEDVSFIFALTGATASTAVAFILPGAFLVKLSKQTGFRNFERGCALAMVIIGVIVMIVSTVVTIIDEVSKEPPE